ncbi:MAG: hypothetical protein KDA80_15575, partial [Planctomycetaceae bacterium]|nr:hypothetical protein [Planctomycetaceae bacterium]
MTETVSISAEEERRIEKFCGHCHAMPKPESFAKEDWEFEVTQGFRFYEAAREEFAWDPPELMTTIAYFERDAKEALPAPQVYPLESVASSLFQRVDAPDTLQATAISHLNVSDISQTVWACDMRTGALLKSPVDGDWIEARRPVQLANPCRVLPLQWDQDEDLELLVSDLG